MLLFFIVVVFFSIVFIMFSRICISVSEFNIKNKDNRLYCEFELKIVVYLIANVKIFSYKINNKLNKASKQQNIKKQINKLKIKNKKQKDKKLKSIKKLINKIEIRNLNLNILIDTENILITTYLVSIISIVIPILLNKYIIFDKKKDRFYVHGLYRNVNYININLKCDIFVKIIEILKYILYNMLCKNIVKKKSIL